MSVSSVAYEVQTGETPGMFHTTGTGFGAGLFAQGIGLGRGKDYVKFSSGGVFGGGWQNRFVVGAKGQLAEIGGMQFTSSPRALSKSGGMSMFGWRNLQGELVEKYLKNEGLLGAASKKQGHAISKGIASGAIPNSFTAALKKHPVRTGFRGLGTVMAVGMTAVDVYHGYETGGVMGAIGAGARSGLEWAAFGAGEAAFASVTGLSLGSVALPVGLAVGAAYGGYKAMKHGGEVSKNLRNMDMVTPINDPHGFGHTMRQRALMGIQKSFINGRMAMGNEGVLMASPRMR